MLKILVADDEMIYHSMIKRALKDQAYLIETCSNGLEAFNKAQQFAPDIIITDVMMPEMNGYELARKLRRQPAFSHTPILVLTTQSELEDKLKAFEAGADDHMTKPFEPAELLARIAVLVRRVETFKGVQQRIITQVEAAKVIAVHSLRGGSGCSSIAVNTALGFTSIWNRPTVLVDLVMNAGQIALMLSGSLKRTWADVAPYSADEVDVHAIRTIVQEHESGLHFIAAPTSPAEGELLTEETLNATINLLRPRYDYLVFDLAHDFGKLSLRVLDIADTILLVIQPELASLRAAFVTLKTYTELGYPEQKIRIVLNMTFKNQTISLKQIENVLKSKVHVLLPYSSDEFISAINHGRPILFSSPSNPVSMQIEDMAYRLSKSSHRKLKDPGTEGWQRVQKRIGR